MISTPSEIVVNDKKYESFYISTNGYILLSSSNKFAAVQDVPSLDYPIIAPFWSDFDTSYNGSIFYRHVNNSGVLNKIASEINGGDLAWA